MILRRLDVVVDGGGFVLWISINLFEVFGGSLVVLVADVERQVAVLAADVNKVLRGVDLALVDKAIALKDRPGRPRAHAAGKEQEEQSTPARPRERAEGANAAHSG